MLFRQFGTLHPLGSIMCSGPLRARLCSLLVDSEWRTECRQASSQPAPESLACQWAAPCHMLARPLLLALARCREASYSPVLSIISWGGDG